MHEAEVGVGVRDDAGQLGIAAQGRDVVDHHGAALESDAGDLGLGGVDRNRLASKRAEDRLDATQLLVERDSIRAGPGGLAADVHDGGARIEHPVRLRRRRLGSEERPAVGERVRRHVDDAHHGRAGNACSKGGRKASVS